MRNPSRRSTKDVKGRIDASWQGRIWGIGCRDCAPYPPPYPSLSEMTCGLSNTTGILQKKKKTRLWFIGVKVKREKKGYTKSKTKEYNKLKTDTTIFLNMNHVF